MDSCEEYEMVGNPLDATHPADTASCEASLPSSGDKECGVGKAPPEPKEAQPFADSHPATDVIADPVQNSVGLDHVHSTAVSPAAESQPQLPSSQSAVEAPFEPVLEDVERQLSQEDVLREEWSLSECHMQDIRYAQQDAPNVPRRQVRQQLKVLVCGQAETGKTLLIKNLFASYTKDATWAPTDVTGLSPLDFDADPGLFQTVIQDKTDASGNLQMTYVVQEAPALEGSAEGCAAMLTKYIKTQQQEYVRQEQDLSLARSDIHDGRVDVCLYTLPTNVRVSAFDCAVMQALGAIVPTVAVMCKADCMTVAEVEERRKEMRKLIQDGLKIYEFPAEALERLPGSGEKLSPPFIIMVGNESDESVHPFWFVRKYRWGTCEAYREVDSDLKWLRQLLLENGYWNIKDKAEELFRCQQPSSLNMEKALVDDSSSHDSMQSYVSMVLTPDPTSPDVGSPSHAVDKIISPDSAKPAAQTWIAPQHCEKAADGRGDVGQQPKHDVDDADFAFDERDYFLAAVTDVHRTSHGTNYRVTLNIPDVNKVLCMRVGASEGACLYNAIRDIEVSRPCTYDTWSQLQAASGCRMVRALITRCSDTVFYGRIHSVAPSPGGDKAIDMDARPSDAFNLAIRTHAPIYVSKEVSDQYGKSSSKVTGRGIF